MLKQIISSSLFLAILGFQSLGHADQRYDIYCVTSPSAPQTVLVYSDLIASYASEYHYEPFTYLKRVSVYTTNTALPRIFKLADVKKSQVLRTDYENADFPSTWTESGVQTISGGRAVDANKQRIVVRDSKEVRFLLPFILTDDDTGEIRKQDQTKVGAFIFDGKPVSSVSVQHCDSSAD